MASRPSEGLDPNISSFARRFCFQFKHRAKKQAETGARRPRLCPVSFVAHKRMRLRGDDAGFVRGRYQPFCNFVAYFTVLGVLRQSPSCRRRPPTWATFECFRTSRPVRRRELGAPKYAGETLARPDEEYAPKSGAAPKATRPAGSARELVVGPGRPHRRSRLSRPHFWPRACSSSGACGV